MNFLKGLYQLHKKHHMAAYSGQLAFFFILSILPFLVVLFTLIGQFSIDVDSLLRYGRLFVPAEILTSLLSFIEGIEVNTGGIISTTLLLALWSSSKAVTSIKTALDMAYEVDGKQGFLVKRLIGMIYTIFLMLAIIFFLILPNLGRSIFNFIVQFIVIKEVYFTLFSYTKWVFMVLFLFLVVIMLFKTLPGLRLKLKDVLYGSLFTTLGWILNALLYAGVINKFTRISVLYGGISIIILLSLWIYINATLVILGGEINSYYYQHLRKEK